MSKESLSNLVLLFSLMLFANSSSVFGQFDFDNQSDSSKLGFSIKPQIGVSLIDRFMGRNMRLPFGTDANGLDVKVHPALLENRRSTYRLTNYDPDSLQDNPVFHNAMQFTFHSRWHIAKGVDLDANLQIEQMGHSFGIYNRNTVLLSPQVRVEIDRDIRVLHQDLNVRAAFGTFRDFRLNEGLLIYGLDLQGYEYSVAYKKLRFRFVQLNDMEVGIGLRMQEVFIANLQLDSLKLAENWKVEGGISGLLTNYYSGPSAKIAFQHKKNLRLYAELGNNQVSDWRIAFLGADKDRLDRFGLVAGLKWNQKIANLDVDLRSEFRYYGNVFLFGRKNQSFGYYGSTSQLVNGAPKSDRIYYPLSYLDRPFSQLALFGDFQTDIYSGNLFATNRDVAAATLFANFKYNLPKQIFLNLGLDFNLIFAEKEAPFLYPFFKFDLGFEPVVGNRISIGYTNKVMDLQLHYPTHQLSKSALFCLSATRDFPEWQKKEWR